MSATSRAVVALAAVAAAACGANPAAPSSPTSLGPLAIACPTPQIRASLGGSPVVVMYPKPVVTGGTQLMAVSCNPPQSAAFPAGTTVVTCEVVDALQRSASCSFDVVIRRFTRFVAFGDSITEGKLSNGTLTSLSYPVLLQEKLDAAYPGAAERPTVFNAGHSGEYVADGLARLPGVLAAEAPDALLLMEGINDIDLGNASTPAYVTQELREMVRTALGRDISVFVATLTPERAGFARHPELIPTTNDQIRAMAASEGATLVDVYAGFGGSPDPWIGSDNLHPTQQGYQQIASIFFDTIEATLQTSTSALFRRTR